MSSHINKNNNRPKSGIIVQPKVTGIKKVVEGVAKAVGKDCGCKKRKDTLNKRFPYNDTL